MKRNGSLSNSVGRHKVDISNCVWKDDENHPFIIPLIKNIREMK